MPPVRAEFCFSLLSSKDNELYFGGVPLFYNFWDEFKYFELIESMRQKTDPKFFDLLCRVRLGIPTEDDIDILNKQKIKINNTRDIYPETAQFYKESDNNRSYSICLFGLTSEVDSCNSEISKVYKIKTVKISAIDFVNNKLINKNNKTKSSETAGLENQLQIGVNSRVMLRRNVNVSSGLCNGAIGTVKAIIKNEFGFITSIKILFDLHDEITPLERFQVQYEFKKNVYCKRQQFPICLAWAITIHKSQGLTILFLIIDLGKSIFEAGMAYVGLSRAKELKNINIIRLDPTVIYCNNRAVSEYNRLRRKFLNKEKLCENPNTLPEKYKNAVQNKIKEKLIQKEIKTQNTERIEKCEPPAKKKCKIDLSVKILKLDNGTNSCYSNAAVQCLISCRTFLLPEVCKI